MFASISGREPQIPMEGVRMARHKMFVDCSKATRELDFKPTGIKGAIERAVTWYVENGYVLRKKNSPPKLGGAQSDRQQPGARRGGSSAEPPRLRSSEVASRHLIERAATPPNLGGVSR